MENHLANRFQRHTLTSLRKVVIVKKRHYTIPPIVILILLALYYLFTSSNNRNVIPSTGNATANPAAPQAQNSARNALGSRVKTSGCQVNGALPDTACTPGAVMETNVQTICQSGYSGSVRNVPSSEKDQVYAEYGIASHTTGEFEVDHLVSLELGGSNDIANLWPEAASPKPGFHEKDKVENYLHAQVCSGKMSLADAQYQIANNWLAVYNQMTK